ncbi:MAG: M20/M25/M40 family metallo-hydrolase [Desulfobacteraceae bacterium]|nr:MAG: M20/M25/M40 family metallo-hydrolase [Desulfobacteraceae bacterium]
MSRSNPCPVNQALVDRLIEETISVQQVPSPTFEEKDLSVHLAGRFKEQGYTRVFTDAAGNVYGRIPGQPPGQPGHGHPPPLVVSAHLDTVFPKTCDLTVTKEKDRIYGPGIGDNSLGVACLILMKDILAALDAEPEGDIILVGNVCEEGQGDLLGMKAVLAQTQPEHPLAYLILEGTSGSRVIYNKGVGSRRYRITAKAPGGHSWNDFGNASAVHALVRLASDLTQLEPVASPKTTFNIGTIDGGISVNTIAETASLLLDLRSESQAGLDDLISQTMTMLDQFSVPDVHIACEQIGDRPSGKAPEDCKLVQLCMDVFEETGFFPVELKAGSTDANIPFSKHMPAVCIGIADGKDAHKESEYLLTDGLDRSIEKVAQIVSLAWSAMS